MKNLKFDLDVKSNALLCPNPSEWFAKSYITENVVNNFRTIPGVKEETKIAKNVFNNVIKSAGCNWSAIDTELNAESVDVCKLDVMVEICQYDLESSFVSMKMAQGDSNWQETEFLGYFWSDLQSEINSEIQQLRWNGNTSLSGDTFLKQCDGYLKKLAASTGATENTDFTGTTFSKDNIIEAMAGTVALLPEAVKSNKKDIRIYMSETNAFYYQLATLGLNTNFNYTGELSLQFAGYEVAVQPGMDDNYIVVANKNSMAYAFDGEGDANSLKIINMMDSTAEPNLRARAGFKVGFHILDKGSEVSYVKAGV